MTFDRSRFQNIPEILDIYENEFNKLSERYFVEFPWPTADLVAPLVQKGTGQRIDIDQFSLFMIAIFLR